MIPTIHDVVGAAVPGLSGLKQAARSQASQFRDLLQQIVGPQGTARTAPARHPAGWAPIRPHVAPRAHATTHWFATSSRTFPQRSPVVGSHVGGGSHDTVSRAALASAIRRAASVAGVEPALSVGVARVESTLNPAARSPDGISHGTFQVTQSTAEEMRRRFAAGVVARPAGSDDVALGVGYLRYLHDLFSKSATLGRRVATIAIPDPHERKLFAVAAFNAGEGRVAQAQARARAAGQDPTRFHDVRPYLPSTTQTYVQRVASAAREEAGGPQIVEERQPVLAHQHGLLLLHPVPAVGDRVSKIA